jgi:hypothetical protein
MTSLDRETGRDRYFAAKERELDALLDPDTGMVADGYARLVPCPLCGGEAHERLFVKRGYPIVRCIECSLIFSNPQVREEVVLDEYREGDSNDLWVDVLTSPRQLELDREKFGEILDELEPFRGDGRLLDVGTSIGLSFSTSPWSAAGTGSARSLDVALSRTRATSSASMQSTPRSRSSTACTTPSRCFRFSSTSTSHARFFARSTGCSGRVA